MLGPKIKLNKNNTMDVLIETHPNISDDELLKGGCYILKMKNGSIISYDCRSSYFQKSWKLRGDGFEINTKLMHYKSNVATRHIQSAPSGIIHKDIQTLYFVNALELDAFHKLCHLYSNKFHEMLLSYKNIKGIESENRYFCTPDLDVIVNVKPNGYNLNPTYCKASAVYDAEEELSLISPHSTGFTWWYYPGRMYFGTIKWIEITKKDYYAAKQFILEKERDIYNMINSIVDDILIR